MTGLPSKTWLEDLIAHPAAVKEALSYRPKQAEDRNVLYIDALRHALSLDSVDGGHS
jgi:hypothetical protein